MPRRRLGMVLLRLGGSEGEAAVAGEVFAGGGSFALAGAPRLRFRWVRLGLGWNFDTVSRIG